MTPTPSNPRLEQTRCTWWTTEFGWRAAQAPTVRPNHDPTPHLPMTKAQPGPRKRKIRMAVFLAMVLAVPVVTWIAIPVPLVRGLALGLVIGPAILVGTFVMFTKRVRTKLESQLSPPSLPSGSWDFALTVTSLGGDPTDFAQFSGRVLILNLWATRCAPCVAEMPSLVRLLDATSDLDVTLACVTREPIEVVRKFAEKQGLEAPIYLLEGEPPECFASRAIPATFILDKSGKIAMRHTGAAAWDDPSVVSFVRGLAATPDR